MQSLYHLSAYAAYLSFVGSLTRLKMQQYGDLRKSSILECVVAHQIAHDKPCPLKCVAWGMAMPRETTRRLSNDLVTTGQLIKTECGFVVPNITSPFRDKILSQFVEAAETIVRFRRGSAE